MGKNKGSADAVGKDDLESDQTTLLAVHKKSSGMALALDEEFFPMPPSPGNYFETISKEDDFPSPLKRLTTSSPKLAKTSRKIEAPLKVRSGMKFSKNSRSHKKLRTKGLSKRSGTKSVRQLRRPISAINNSPPREKRKLNLKDKQLCMASSIKVGPRLKKIARNRGSNH